MNKLVVDLLQQKGLDSSMVTMVTMGGDLGQLKSPQEKV